MRQAALTTHLLVLTLSMGFAFCAVNFFATRKHFTPDVQPILAHLDEHLPVMTGREFTISDLNEINEHSLAHDLDAVVQTEFFSIFKADIQSKCTFGAVYSQCALEGGCDITDSGNPVRNLTTSFRMFHKLQMKFLLNGTISIYRHSSLHPLPFQMQSACWNHILMPSVSSVHFPRCSSSRHLSKSGMAMKLIALMSCRTT